MTNTEFKTLRESTGLSIQEAAKFFDTPYHTWYKWESGARRVPGLAVVALRMYIDGMEVR